MLSIKDNNCMIHYVIISFLVGKSNLLFKFIYRRKNINIYLSFFRIKEKSFNNINRNLKFHYPKNPQLSFLLINIHV